VRLGHPARFLLVLMAVTAGLSAFLNHDIVCFVFTPIVGATLLRRRINSRKSFCAGFRCVAHRCGR